MLAIEALPLKDKIIEDISLIVKGLREDGRPAAIFEVKEQEYQFSIEADPQFRRLDIYDDHFKKISLSALGGDSLMRGSRIKRLLKL